MCLVSPKAQGSTWVAFNSPSQGLDIGMTLEAGVPLRSHQSAHHGFLSSDLSCQVLPVGWAGWPVTPGICLSPPPKHWDYNCTSPQKPSYNQTSPTLISPSPASNVFSFISKVGEKRENLGRLSRHHLVPASQGRVANPRMSFPI